PRVILRPGFDGRSPARNDGRSARQALEAVAVKRAGTAESGITGVSPYADMPHLGMEHPPQRAPIDHDTAADAGTDGDVSKRAHARFRTQLRLRQRRRIDVCIN